MQSFKTNLYVGFICLALGLGIGRYTNRGIGSTTDTTKDTQQAQDTKKITVIITAPDGKKTKTETTEVDSHTSTETKKSVDVVVKPKQPIINFSALAGTDINQPFKPIYGVSVSKEILGPVTAGVWVLSNSTVGISVGVNF
jgi:hypothetical protein